MSAEQVKSRKSFPGAGSCGTPKPRAGGGLAVPGRAGASHQPAQTVESPGLERVARLQPSRCLLVRGCQGRPSPSPQCARRPPPMIQKSHPALLQPHDVGDSVETLMVNAYGRRREGRIPGRPLGEVAKGPWSGSGGGEPFSRPRHAQSWGLVGTDDGEEGGEDCSAFRLGRQSKGRAVAVVSVRDGRNCRGLGGFRENVPARTRKRCDRYWALLRVGCLKWQRWEDSWACKYLGHLEA